MGWRFIGPQAAWVWAPVSSIFIIGLFTFGMEKFSKMIEQGNIRNDEESGELILYGNTTTGEVLAFNQTGTYINEQPEFRFDIKINGNHYTYNQIIPLHEMHQLRKGQVDILQLPSRPQIFKILNYIG